jgi:O-antigen ligase
MSMLGRTRLTGAAALTTGPRSYTASVLRQTVRPATFPLVSVVLVGVMAGMLVARAQNRLPSPLIGLLTLAGLVLVLTMQSRHLFLGWLFAASFLEPTAADVTGPGRALVWALYVGPAAGLLLLTLLRRAHRVSALDLAPLGYVAFVLVSIVLTTNLIHTDLRNTLKVVFLNIALGVVVYYFLTVGPGAFIERDVILKLFLYGGIAQGALAVVDAMTGWNVWGSSQWQGIGGVSRATSTLANPAVLGAYLGVTTVIAVAVLVWGGPRSLRRLALASMVFSVPGLFLTLTRGPILGALLGAVALLVFGRSRLLAWGIIAVTALVIVTVLPTIQRSPLYHERIAESQNVQFRVAIQNLSLHLAAQKPLLGWGYGSFDRVKDRAGVVPASASGQSVLQITSHNTYLTMLVELGGLGLLLYAAPFVVFGLKGFHRVRARGPDSWISAAALAALCVVVFTGATLDYRFFSFALMLPWVFLAILRRPTAVGDPADVR